MTDQFITVKELIELINRLDSNGVVAIYNPHFGVVRPYFQVDYNLDRKVNVDSDVTVYVIPNE